MSTSLDFIEYVCAQIKDEFISVRYKKMFGEYMVYVEDKPMLLVCDNCVYVKQIKELTNLMQSSPCGVPYNGAKLHFIIDPEDRELLCNAISILKEVIPVPKSRKK